MGLVRISEKLCKRHAEIRFKYQAFKQCRIVDFDAGGIVVGRPPFMFAGVRGFIIRQLYKTVCTLIPSVADLGIGYCVFADKAAKEPDAVPVAKIEVIAFFDASHKAFAL